MAADVNVPWVLFALSREALFVKRDWRRVEKLPHLPGRAWVGQRDGVRVLFAQTGVGRKAAHRVLEELLAQAVALPPLVVSAGFAGALAPGLEVGSVVTPCEVVDEEGNTWSCAWPGGGGKGRLVTVSRLVADPRHKADLATRHNAETVDMESAALARLCAWRGVPFSCVRAVSDDAATPLDPALASLLADGRVRLPGLLALLLRRPACLRSLLGLAWDTRRAARRLAQALTGVLTSPGSAPPTASSGPRSGCGR